MSEEKDVNDLLIEKYDFEADMLDRFVRAGEDKGEVALMFGLLEEENRTDNDNLVLNKLFKKFKKNKNSDIQLSLEFLVKEK